jgi:tetratricopeptide (TPR) repeat protein
MKILLHWVWAITLVIILLLITILIYNSLDNPAYYDGPVGLSRLGSSQATPGPASPFALQPPELKELGLPRGRVWVPEEDGAFPLPDRGQRYLELLVDWIGRSREAEPAAAREALEELERLDAPDPRIYRWLGMLYHQEGAYPAAATAFERALALNPGHHTDLFNLATLYLELERYPQAIRTYNRLLPLQPPFLDDVYANLGYCLHAMGDEAQAQRAWEVSLQLDPTNPVARRHAGKKGTADRQGRRPNGRREPAPPVLLKPAPRIIPKLPAEDG